jgi:hypothetical protein
MPGRGTLEKEKQHIFGMVQRGGAIILHLLPMFGRPRSSHCSWPASLSAA